MKLKSIWTIAFIIFVGFLAAGCSSSSSSDGGDGGTDTCGQKELLDVSAPLPTVDGRIYSFGVSPNNFPSSSTTEDFTNFYCFLGSLNNGGVLAGESWRDDKFGVSDGGGAIPEIFTQYRRLGATYGFEPIYIVGWDANGTLLLNQPAPGNTDNSWSNTESTAKFQQMLVTFAETLKPRYLFIGNEVNLYDGSDYLQWVAFYEGAYDAIKAVSPNTNVGTIFQYEDLSGNTALSQPNHSADWEKLTRFDLDKLDVIGITLYPFFQYATAASVPADYLQPLIDRVGNKPIAITETGWPSDNLFGASQTPPWETSPTAQVVYSQALDGVIDGLNVPVLSWLYVHPLNLGGAATNTTKIFTSIALYDSTNVKLPIYDVWVGKANQ